MELMTPTGNPLIPDTFAIISAITRNAAPNAIDPGMRILFFEPTNALAMCGPTKPMNPIVPVKQTIPAVIRETNVMQAILSLEVFTPSVRAQLSPEYITSNFLYMAINNALVTVTIDTTMGSSSHPILDKEPTLQWYALAMSSAGDVTMKYCVIELNTYIIAIPMRIIAVGDILLNLDMVTNMPMRIFDTP